MSHKNDLAASACDQMLAQQDKITRLHGDINPETVYTVEEEIGNITTTVKLYHFKEGNVFGHLAVIIPESEM